MSQHSNSYFAKVQRGELPLPAITSTLGGRIIRVDQEAGEMEVEYRGQPAFLNPAGQIQGGMLGAMLDDVTAFLLTAMLGENEYCSTLNLNISFLRPASEGVLQGRSRVVRRGATISNVTGELLQDGKLVATAVATCMVVRKG